MKNFDLLLRSGKTIFGYDNLSLLLWTQNTNTLKSYIQRATKSRLLQKIASGIYGLYQYDILELAASLRNKSYISLETVLHGEWAISQSDSITLVSDNTIRKTITEKEIRFYKIKDSILLNPIGINYTGKYMIASRERAICDMIYLFGEYPIADLGVVNLEKLENIASIYNKATILYIQKLIKHATKN